MPCRCPHPRKKCAKKSAPLRCARPRACCPPDTAQSPSPHCTPRNPPLETSRWHWPVCRIFPSPKADKGKSSWPAAGAGPPPPTPRARPPRTFRRGSTPLFFAVHTFDYAIICLFYLQLLQHPLLYYPFSFILATILCSYAYKTDSHPITPKHVL